MRKIVSPAAKCDKSGHIIEYEKSEEFCDHCGLLINMEKTYPLHMAVFIHGSAESYPAEFCSWKCVKSYLLTNKEKLLKTEFISLPYPCARKHGKPYIGTMQDFYREFM